MASLRLHSSSSEYGIDTREGVVSDTEHRKTRARRCPLLLGMLALWALPAPAMLLDSSSSLYENGIWIGFSDPPPTQGVIGVRQVNGFGTASSSIQHDLVADHNGPFSYLAQSAINVDPATGISFGGLASVVSTPAFTGLDGRAHTEGGFIDENITISGGPANVVAFLAFPLHITGAVDTLGAVFDGFSFVHDGVLSYQFATDNCGFNRTPCPSGKVEFSTPGETIPGPVSLDQSVTVKVPFFFDTPFFLSAVFSVDADLGVPFDTTPGAAAPSSRTVADFSHTLAVGPATIIDANGAPIANAFISNGDYNFLVGPTAPPSPPPSTGVPEPASTLLVLAGLIGWMASPGGVRRARVVVTQTCSAEASIR